MFHPQIRIMSQIQTYNKINKYSYINYSILPEHIPLPPWNCNDVSGRCFMILLTNCMWLFILRLHGSLIRPWPHPLSWQLFQDTCFAHFRSLSQLGTSHHIHETAQTATETFIFYSNNLLTHCHKVSPTQITDQTSVVSSCIFQVYPDLFQIFWHVRPWRGTFPRAVCLSQTAFWHFSSIFRNRNQW